jgi:hypothetical protein
MGGYSLRVKKSRSGSLQKGYQFVKVPNSSGFGPGPEPGLFSLAYIAKRYIFPTYLSHGFSL